MSAASELKTALRQMLAVLESERQALAALDLDTILATAADKERLCGTLADADAGSLDEESIAMLEAARRQNEVNRQIRNLVAANVQARIDVLAGRARLYCLDTARPYTIARR
ncbi:MAG: flagellar protein FlgN [Novosphingobium sp.]|nr:flagellar protein FlgN [Novosphingobium sp.]